MFDVTAVPKWKCERFGVFVLYPLLHRGESVSFSAPHQNLSKLLDCNTEIKLRSRAVFWFVCGWTARFKWYIHASVDDI